MLLACVLCGLPRQWLRSNAREVRQRKPSREKVDTRQVIRDCTRISPSRIQRPGIQIGHSECPLQRPTCIRSFGNPEPSENQCKCDGRRLRFALDCCQCATAAETPSPIFPQPTD